MKHLKKFENLEEDNSEILSDLEYILQDLKDEYFDVSIVDEKRYRRIVKIKSKYLFSIGFIKDTTGGLAEEFKLSEIKESFDRVKDYMKSNGFEIENIDAFNLSKSLNISPDTNQWNLDMKVLGINFYFN
jgi:hypothetical protein